MRLIADDGNAAPGLFFAVGSQDFRPGLYYDAPEGAGFAAAGRLSKIEKIYLSPEPCETATAKQTQ
jgi:hypothetical protein